ncbi:glycosyltransferase 87 family protein [Microlunatus flavus]|uniref:Alpha-1,2-mannosyltransferase n=1 Tax=Microlunatus flavus TaxID=1036181 RepID=A0A1H9MSS2_9ACTN|nr:glycosyltransferase 87 family protein [Microlunatus flavus]SER26756.1 alpha-1,2-mannosyltransferase [Microlunatus flavus]
MTSSPAVAAPESGAPAPQHPLTPGRRALLLLAEVGPPAVVALLVLPFVIAYSHWWPRTPNTIDLQVYVYAVKDMLAGRDIFATTTPGWHLYFIYPPISAVLMTPLAFGPYLFWQLAWTVAGVGAQQSVLRRCGVQRGWRLALVGSVAVVAVEPIRTTLGYGQVNTFLMALVVADLLPRWPGAPQHERPWRGVLVGLAASVKLTPALFGVFAFLAGRRRLAIVSGLSFLAFTAVGYAFLPRNTVEYYTGLSGGDTRSPASPFYVGNQNLLSVFYRLIDTSRTTSLLGFGVAATVAVVGTLVAVHWWRVGQKVFAIALVGLCTNLASPVSWTHHYVWILPMGVAVLTQALPRWVRVVAGFWVVWVCLCPPLALLPYGNRVEATYSPLQELVANLGPVTGAVLVLGLAVHVLATRNREVPRHALVAGGAPVTAPALPR